MHLQKKCSVKSPPLDCWKQVFLVCDLKEIFLLLLITEIKNRRVAFLRRILKIFYWKKLIFLEEIVTDFYNDFFYRSKTLLTSKQSNIRFVNDPLFIFLGRYNFYETLKGTYSLRSFLALWEKNVTKGVISS